MQNSKKAGKGRKKAKPRGKNKAGRPQFEPTKEQRERVEVLIAARLSEDDIARDIGISRGTLRKEFKEELATGAARRRADVLMAQYRSAMAGNASAQEKFLRKGEVEAGTQGSEGASPQKQKLGKKEERQQAAANVSGKFAPPAPPKLVVNNA